MSATTGGVRTPLCIVRAQGEHAEAVAELFERVDCPCYCQYWDFPGDRRQWQDRCANGRALSRAELEAALARDPSTEQALFALAAFSAADGTCVGWMRLESPARMHKTYEGQLYRGLPCFSGDRSGVLGVACFLVDEDWRRRGVATELLAEGIRLAKEAGARALEAFPRRAEGVTAEEHWTGPPGLFEAHGFRVVHEFGPYPVLRLDLSPCEDTPLTAPR